MNEIMNKVLASDLITTIVRIITFQRGIGVKEYFSFFYIVRVLMVNGLALRRLHAKSQRRLAFAERNTPVINSVRKCLPVSCVGLFRDGIEQTNERAERFVL